MAKRALRIAVVGGGLGGTTTAIMLQRAGHDVKVYEQAPAIDRLGAGIHLFPNAVMALRGVGLEDTLLARAFLPRHFAQREWDTGELTFDLRSDQFPTRYGAHHVILHRGDLQTLLNAALAPGVLHLGKRLVGLDDTASSIRLTFAGGNSAEADLVVGADGLNSKVREILIGPERATYTGHVAHRAIYPAVRLGGEQVADATKWWAEDRYFLSYYLTPQRDELYVVTGVPQAWKSGTYAPQPTDLEQFARMFEGFHSEVQEQIRACPAAVTWPVLYREPREFWSSGRIVLLGDACHPMKPHMGQGAAMAMEDAAVLGRCIEDCGEDFPAAFRMYEALRFDRTTRVKLESDKHEWMRYGSDCDWLYGYNAFEVALDAAPKADMPNRALARVPRG
jgi:6-hydroxynicotinate 3-monooxygenase